MFALQYDLMRKAQGKTVTSLTGDSTISELIAIYSAAQGVELEKYIDFVCRRVGLNYETKLSELLVE